MKNRVKVFTIIFAIIALGLGVAACVHSMAATEDKGLKDIFADDFLVGVAINARQVQGIDTLATQLIKRHFNSIVAENAMKSEQLNPREGYYNWGPADDFVKFGESNKMFIVGHCLVWHSQLAEWFPLNAEGDLVDAETLRKRMHDYIYEVVGRYRGRVHGWDVVNEAVLEDGTYRQSPFYLILGEEYIPLAFQYAHEADPDAELYINDYGMDRKERRDKYVAIVNDLKSRHLRIDAIGMQGHMGIDYPDFKEFEASLQAFANTGCKVMLTEWDMSALPTINTGANVADLVSYSDQLNPYPDSLPQDISELWNQRMDSVLEIFLRHSQNVSRINAWGVIDSDSWKNDWPMHGRTEYPLLFDRQYKPKAFLEKRLKGNKS